MSYDSTGSGAKPRLGSGKTRTQSRPGRGESLAGAGRGDSPKVARPGGATHLGKGAGSSPKVARPGGPEGISK